MASKSWKVCQTCHGNGKIMKEVKPGKWENQYCPACKGVGGWHTGTV